jgi:gluconokinase
MDPKLLESQFETLEEPTDAIVVDVAATPADIVRQIRSSLAI